MEKYNSRAGNVGVFSLCTSLPKALFVQRDDSTFPSHSDDGVDGAASRGAAPTTA
jgi:hypothetical protein